MATLTNKPANTITPTNKQLGSQLNMTWDAATFTWDESLPATWDNPMPVKNKVANTTTLTNKLAQ